MTSGCYYCELNCIPTQVYLKLRKHFNKYARTPAKELKLETCSRSKNELAQRYSSKDSAKSLH